MQSSSQTSRRLVAGSSLARKAQRMALNQSPQASAIDGLPGTSGSRSRLKNASAFAALAWFSGTSAIGI
ncbi:hypothetical protein ACVMHZ_001211 [Bradyrhizobium liaoningense]